MVLVPWQGSARLFSALGDISLVIDSSRKPMHSCAGGGWRRGWESPAGLPKLGWGVGSSSTSPVPARHVARPCHLPACGNTAWMGSELCNPIPVQQLSWDPLHPAAGGTGETPRAGYCCVAWPRHSHGFEDLMGQQIIGHKIQVDKSNGSPCPAQVTRNP